MNVTSFLPAVGLVLLGAACLGCGLWAGLRIGEARWIAESQNLQQEIMRLIREVETAQAQLQTQLQQPVQRHSPLPRPVVKGKQLTDDKEKSAKK